MNGRLLTAREVADRLGVTVETVLRWTRAGELPGFRLGRALRFREADLEVWLEQHATGAAPRGVSPTQGDRAHMGGYAPVLSAVSPTAPPTAAPTEEVP